MTDRIPSGGGERVPVRDALTFDDVLLEPLFSDIGPVRTSTRSRLTPGLELNIPVLSAAMDTVTEAPMAIAMAQAGGLGVIHKNFSPAEQAREVRRVKRFESGMVVNPVTIGPDATLGEVLDLMQQHAITGIPVVERDGTLAGILTNRDVRFAVDRTLPVRTLMTTSVVTVPETIRREEAKRLLHQKRIEKLVVVDDRRRCTGLITVRDIEKSEQYPMAIKDSQGRLRCAAAVGVQEGEIERVRLLVEEDCDVVVVDTAHGHSAPVLSMVKRLKTLFPGLDIIGGNVATAEGARQLFGAGADVVKVGIGPGSICTTRIVAGVGVPQLTAVMACAEVAAQVGKSIIADGGIRYSGDFAKALAAGAGAIMIGSLLAGTDEAPGDVIYYKGQACKSFRGMGSLGAMARGSADRYFQEEIREIFKMAPEGVEGRVPYRGSVFSTLRQLAGGLQAALGYVGAPDIDALRQRARFIRITPAGMRESHPHGVMVTHEAPNYVPPL